MSWWNNTFFFAKCGHFSWFHHSSAVISLHNTHRWFFFLFQDNQSELFHVHLKNWCYDFSSRWNCLRLLRSRFSPFGALFWLFLRLRCEVIDPCFIHGYESTQKPALLLWNIAKHSIETSSRRCFCSIVSKRGIQLAHSFLMTKFLFNMRCTFCQKSTGNWSIKHKLFIIHPNLFYRLQSMPLLK